LCSFQPELTYYINIISQTRKRGIECYDNKTNGTWGAVMDEAINTEVSLAGIERLRSQALVEAKTELRQYCSNHNLDEKSTNALVNDIGVDSIKMIVPHYHRKQMVERRALSKTADENATKEVVQ
jgi:hypothetical protein